MVSPVMLLTLNCSQYTPGSLSDIDIDSLVISTLQLSFVTSTTQKHLTIHVKLLSVDIVLVMYFSYNLQQNNTETLLPFNRRQTTHEEIETCFFLRHYRSATLGSPLLIRHFRYPCLPESCQIS